MVDDSKKISWAHLLWSCGACIGVSVGASFVVGEIMRDSVRDRVDAFEMRFASDIAQHDQRIASNGNDFRALLVMLGIPKKDLPEATPSP